MAKDRLGDLLQVQGNKNNNVAVDIENGSAQTNENGLRKTFERAEVVRQWIQGIEEKHLRDKLENLFQNNTSICHKINPKLKEIEEELKTINVESAEGRIKSIQYNTLKTRYQNIFKKNSFELENFRNIQKSYLEAQLRAKGVRVTDEELVSLLENNTDIQLFTDNIIAETAEAKRVLADLEDRHQGTVKNRKNVGRGSRFVFAGGYPCG
ncbi:hypothetical protein NQ317_013683 [Molorchus minor]|uniref:Uncharacterized protein n=1 Tax=Molorchus minor TaxID=1323400 RepID=A0ABQ9JBD2_9CUCU|nr:hypothetical protein NQ317_013683 [Molorchus minor]